MNWPISDEMLAMPSPMDELRKRLIAYAIANDLVFTGVEFSEDSSQLLATFRKRTDDPR
jgi:hypothetical protein